MAADLFNPLVSAAARRVASRMAAGAWTLLAVQGQGPLRAKRGSSLGPVPVFIARS